MKRTSYSKEIIDLTLSLQNVLDISEIQNILASVNRYLIKYNHLSIKDDSVNKIAFDYYISSILDDYYI